MWTTHAIPPVRISPNTVRFTFVPRCGSVRSSPWVAVPSRKVASRQHHGPSTSIICFPSGSQSDSARAQPEDFCPRSVARAGPASSLTSVGSSVSTNLASTGAASCQRSAQRVRPRRRGRRRATPATESRRKETWSVTDAGQPARGGDRLGAGNEHDKPQGRVTLALLLARHCGAGSVAGGTDRGFMSAAQRPRPVRQCSSHSLRAGGGNARAQRSPAPGPRAG
jgi:hypothetical protein